MSTLGGGRTLDLHLRRVTRYPGNNGQHFTFSSNSLKVSPLRYKGKEQIVIFGYINPLLLLLLLL